MRKLFVLLFIHISLNHGVSQSGLNLFCNDSTDHYRINILIDSMLKKQSKFQFGNDELMTLLTEVEEECLIRNYAKCFDYLFECGVDLFNRLPRPSPPRNSRKSVMTQEEYDLIKRDTIKEDIPKNRPTYHTDMFLLFINLKKNYEYYLSNVKDIDSFESNVRLLIRYGDFKYPTITRDVLLGKFRHITRQKITDDFSLWPENYQKNFIREEE